MIRRALAPNVLRALFIASALAAAYSLLNMASAQAETPTPTATAPPGYAIERIAPPFQLASQSQSSFSVDVTVENVSGLGAYDVLITFDSAQVNFVSAVDGPFLGSTGRSEICPAPIVQPLSGSMRKLHFGCGTIGPTPPPGASGSGILATISFAPVSVGTADLLLEPSLSDTLGNAINAVAYGGQVDIQPGPTATPTSTLTPTATSTPCPGGVCPTPTPVQCSPTQVAVEPPTVAGHPGVVLDVPLVVHNVCDLGGFQLTLGYDAALLTFSQAHEGAFLGSSGRTVQCAAPQLLQSAVRFNCVTLGTPPPDGASGTGTLATLSFVPNNTGSSALTLQEAILVKPNADPMSTTTADGTAVITACGTCTTVTPTPSPSPTLTPTVTQTPVRTLTATPCGGTCPTPTSTAMLATATSTPASSPATVRIEPPVLSGHPGDTIIVPVWVDNVVNLGGFGFQLSWNPALFSFASATVGPLLESTGRSSFCDVNTNGGPGTVLYSCSTLGNSLPGASGSGVLGYIGLYALGTGSSALTVSQVTLVTPPAQPIPVGSVQGGSATITSCSGACPTPSITPTATATATPGGSGATTVSISPTTFTVSPGDTFSVDVLVSNVRNLGSFQFTFEFNTGSRFIDFVSVQAGPFLGSTGRPVFCPAPSVTAFDVNYGCVSSGSGALGPNGSGLLATLTFRANNFGSNSLFGVSSASLSDPLANDIPTQLGPKGDVESLPAAATSTATGTASATPTSTPAGPSAQPARALSAAAATPPPLQGDVNGDCTVNVADMQDIASRYGATLGMSTYLPSRDLEPAQRDGAITIGDVQYVFGRIGTQCGDPPPKDSDGDGCPDSRELGPDWHAGGQRDANSASDVFDVPVPALLPANTTGMRNKAIALNDVLAIVTYVGTSASSPTSGNANGAKYGTDLNLNGVPDGQEYDRTASTTPGQPWRSGPPNGAVSLQDALVALNQVGTNCN